MNVPKKQPETALVCWNCQSTRISKRSHADAGEPPEHNMMCRECGADGAPEDFVGIASTAAILNRMRRRA